MVPGSSNQLTDAFFCAICFNAFRKPKILPACGHCFCYACIQSWYKCDGSTTGVLKCPVCRRSVNLKHQKVLKRGLLTFDCVLFRKAPTSNRLSKYLDDCATAKLANKLQIFMQISPSCTPASVRRSGIQGDCSTTKEGAKVLLTVRDRLTCPICKFVLDDPRMLPACQHSFCLSCLQMEYKQNGSEKGTLTCQVCDKRHRFDKRFNKNKPPSVVQIGNLLPFDYVLSVLLEHFRGSA